MSRKKTSQRLRIEVSGPQHFDGLNSVYWNCCEGIEDEFDPDGIDYLCGLAEDDGLGPCPDKQSHGSLTGACAEHACRFLDDIVDAMLAYRATTPEEINSQLFLLARRIVQGRFILSVAGVLSDPAHPEEDDESFGAANGYRLEEYATRLCCILSGEDMDDT